MFVLAALASLMGCRAPDDSGTPYTADTHVADSAGDTDTNETGETDSSELIRPERMIEYIIIFVMDTARWDSHNPEVMPFLTGLIENEGIDLRKNWGSGNWTFPTVPAIATGHPGFSLGENAYRDNSVPQIPEGISTLGERFAAAGWRTRADLCNQVAFDGEGMRGMANVEICANPETNTTTALDQFERTAEWIAAESGPAFVWIQVMESHDPFNRPHSSCKAETYTLTQACTGWNGFIEGDPWWDRNDATMDAACKAAIIAAYECDTRQLDEDIEAGMAHLDSMGLLENTVIFFTADHGEHFLEPHGPGMDEGLAHHRHMYAQVSRVSAAMWWKGANPSTVATLTGHHDVAPTLLDIAGIPVGDNPMEGDSIFELTENPDADERIVTQFACDSGGTDSGAGYMVGGVHYHTILRDRTRAGEEVTWATYDVTTDPDETTPLVDFIIPEEIREVLQNQADVSASWTCY